jgi:hypothetical protein
VIPGVRIGHLQARLLLLLLAAAAAAADDDDAAAAAAAAAAIEDADLKSEANQAMLLFKSRCSRPLLLPSLFSVQAHKSIWTA